MTTNLTELAAIDPGTVLAHVGMPKTATTAIQVSLASARAELVANGVLYPGYKHNHSAASFSLAGRVHGWRGKLDSSKTSEAAWDELTKAVRSASQSRVVVSHEYFAELPAARVRKFVADFERPVHVVFTLRNQASLLSSTWQQTLKGGQTRTFDQWLHDSLHPNPKQRYGRLMRRLQLADLVEKWAEVVGEQNVTLIVVDKSDRHRIFNSFEQLLGLPAGLLPTEGDGRTSNRSMTQVEATLFQQVNAEIINAEERSWSVFQQLYRKGAINQLLAARTPAEDEQRIVPPAWAVDRVTELTKDHVARIAKLDINVVGDLAGLAAPIPSVAPEDDVTADVLPMEIATTVISGVLHEAFREEYRRRQKRAALKRLSRRGPRSKDTDMETGGSAQAVAPMGSRLRRYGRSLKNLLVRLGRG